MLIEWPDNEEKPSEITACTLPATTTRRELVRRVKERWRTERVYEDAKGELGLDHFEGRTHRGWHHHVSVVLCCFAVLRLSSLNANALFPLGRPSRRAKTAWSRQCARRRVRSATSPTHSSPSAWLSARVPTTGRRDARCATAHGSRPARMVHVPQLTADGTSQDSTSSLLRQRVRISANAEHKKAIVASPTLKGRCLAC